MADDFEPYTMEITKQLDLAEADEKAVAKFRQEAFDDEDAILQMTVGPQLTAARRIILWARWRQFVQRIVLARAADEGEAPVMTEEVTRRYRISQR